MRTVGNLTSLKGTVCVYMASKPLGELFLKNAEAEGFVFSDGSKPTEKEWESIMLVEKDWTIRYLVGFAAHMAFNHPESVSGEPLVRIDYRKYIAGEENYFYEKAQERLSGGKSSLDKPCDNPADSERNLLGSDVCFLVKGREIEDRFSSFWDWLSDNRFRSWGQSEHNPKVDWVFINMRSKLYAIGFKLADPIFGHAITVDEFFTVWNIYSKYNA